MLTILYCFHEAEKKKVKGAQPEWNHYGKIVMQTIK